MKTYIILVLSFLLFTAAINAQQTGQLTKINKLKDTGPPIDTTDFFPIQIGNYWEYAASSINGPVYFGTTVIGDTLKRNGKIYKILLEKYFNGYYLYTWYFRKDSNNIYRYTGGDSTQCGYGEHKYFDFDSKDSTTWSICTNDTINNSIGNARGIERTYYDYTYYRFFQKPI